MMTDEAHVSANAPAYRAGNTTAAHASKDRQTPANGPLWVVLWGKSRGTLAPSVVCEPCKLRASR